MNNFIMLTGIPGCGKSTLAKELKEQYPNAIVISSDEVRKEVYGDITDQLHNRAVFKLIENLIVYNLDINRDVIFDATNIYRSGRKDLLKKLPKNTKKIVYAFTTDIDDCMKRNSKRDRVVPVHVILRMFEEYKIPVEKEGWDEINIIK